MIIKREHVDKALNEIERRLDQEAKDSDYTNDDLQAAKDKIDGMCATFMMIADNWLEVSYWIDRGIEERMLLA